MNIPNLALSLQDILLGTVGGAFFGMLWRRFMRLAVYLDRRGRQTKLDYWLPSTDARSSSALCATLLRF